MLHITKLTGLVFLQFCLQMFLCRKNEISVAFSCRKKFNPQFPHSYPHIHTCHFYPIMSVKLAKSNVVFSTFYLYFVPFYIYIKSKLIFYYVNFSLLHID